MKSICTRAPLRIAVLDDHPLIGKAIQYSLLQETDLQLVAVFTHRQEMMPAIERAEFDLLVLDYLLGDQELDGLQLVRQLHTHYPDLPILVSSSVESPAVVQLVIKAGARGYIGKSKDLSELICAIRQVAAGKRFLSYDMQLEIEKLQESDKELKEYIKPRTSNEDIPVLIRELSPRELEVIRCYLRGMTLPQIAAKYSRSRKTISGQKQSALRKLGLRSDIELFKYQNIFTF